MQMWKKKYTGYIGLLLVTKADLWLIVQVLSGHAYLVGEKLSCADVLLVECTLMLEEKFPSILLDFPNIKVNV